MERDPGGYGLGQIRRASLDAPGATRSLSRGEGSLAFVGSLAIGRARLDPGWRWSLDVQPIVGTPTCEAHHLHILTAGRFAVRMASGEYQEFEPGDVFDIPPGHDAWVIGDEAVELLDVSGNVADFGQPSGSARATVTMVMTDIVASTQVVAALGDRLWRQKLSDHDRLVRGHMARFRGRELATTGDGFLVAFESATAALRFAKTVTDAVREQGIEVRVGVHTGEIEMTRDGARGIAVHAVARIMSAAEPSEVLASAVTRVLAEGSDASFTSRGSPHLKGLPAPIELFAVR